MTLSQCVISSFKRLTLSNCNSHRCISSGTAPLLFRVTDIAWAEPLKKKKKMDPMVLRQREERRKKKIEKAIRKLEKNASQFKPLDEMEVPLKLLRERELRTRTNPSVTEEEEILQLRLLKQWSIYKKQQCIAETYMMDCMQTSTNRALEELRKESEELWLEAIQLDPMLIPYRAKGPDDTPPIKDYDAPDGEYKDETKKWE
ncbi:39S ribosomal protein L40, mitochondrial [Halocaridina rubra]|uniref:Large ribosomal subunit protein mL40 n=1 Tax=Halocaridina rubra TaxID=373956 RepID=A0AAN8X718_HALRR